MQISMAPAEHQKLPLCSLLQLNIQDAYQELWSFATVFVSSKCSEPKVSLSKLSFITYCSRWRKYSIFDVLPSHFAPKAPDDGIAIVLRKARQGVEKIGGHATCLPGVDDIATMPDLCALVKKVMCWRPIVPIMPRSRKEDHPRCNFRVLGT